jgi:uncharacterized Fe-S cluster-containing radical SAM superfamily protein
MTSPPLIQKTAASIVVGGACNTQCLFCKFFVKPKEVNARQHLEKLELVVEQCAEAGCEKIYWGWGDFEPTTFALLPQAMRAAQARNIANQTLITNGILTADSAYLKELKESGLTSLRISLFEWDAHSADVLCRSTGVQRAKLETLKNCLSLGINIQASVLLMRVNYQKLPEILEWLGPVIERFDYPQLMLASTSHGLKQIAPFIMPPLSGVLEVIRETKPAWPKVRFDVVDVPRCFRELWEDGWDGIGFPQSKPGNCLDICAERGERLGCSGVPPGYLEVYPNEIRDRVVVHNPLDLQGLEEACRRYESTSALELVVERDLDSIQPNELFQLYDE